MPEEETAEQTSEPKKKRKIPMALILIVGVTVVEAVGFFAVGKFFGGGTQVAHGADSEQGNVLDGDQATGGSASVEVSLLKNFKVPNSDGGRQYIYDFDISIKAPTQRQEEAEKLVQERGGELSDRIARIVRRAKHAQLAEPDLKTLRVQIQHAIGEVAGDQEMVLEVLIPRCVPIRAD